MQRGAISEAEKAVSWIELEDALPGLISARRAGTLVPFVGAGMSMDYCKGWVPFIQDLCKQFGHEDLARSLDTKVGKDRENEKPGAEVLYRVADRVAGLLRLRPAEERRSALAEALRASSSEFPPQLTELTKVSWPLIVTTNYDDLIVASIRQPHVSRVRDLPEPRVLARDHKDCIDVVRSLDILQQPIVWHVQGHVPGIAGAKDGSILDQLEPLLNQVVLGHQEYQQAINADPAFRRAFAEVFRRRSLLFLGSGLAESYMVNLISEALFNFGPSPHPHYALLTREEARRADPDFLAVRLGITPVVYGEAHAELPAAIRSLVAEPAVQSPLGVSKDGTSASGLRSLTFSLQHVDSGKPLEVQLVHGPLPTAPLAEDGCVVLSVGLDHDTRPNGRFTRIAFGQQAWDFARHYTRPHGLSTTDFVPADDKAGQGLAPHRVFRHKEDGRVLLASATVAAAGDITDTRDLQTITEVTRAALRIAAVDHSTLTMGMIGAGDLRPFSSAYCLLTQLSGIRSFLEAPRERGRLQAIRLHVYDGEAWSALAYGRIPAAELLFSGLVRVLVRVVGGGGRCEEFALSVRQAEKVTVRAVLARYGYDVPGLQVSAYPFTRQGKDSIEGGLLDTAVFPGMVIEVRAPGC